MSLTTLEPITIDQPDWTPACGAPKWCHFGRPVATHVAWIVRCGCNWLMCNGCIGELTRAIALANNQNDHDCVDCGATIPTPLTDHIRVEPLP